MSTVSEPHVVAETQRVNEPVKYSRLYRFQVRTSGVTSGGYPFLWVMPLQGIPFKMTRRPLQLMKQRIVEFIPGENIPYVTGLPQWPATGFPSVELKEGDVILCEVIPNRHDDSQAFINRGGTLKSFESAYAAMVEAGTISS